MGSRLEDKEVLNEISVSGFLEQVDSKVWRVHLLIYNSRLVSELMITERNKQKRAGPFLTLPVQELNIDSFLSTSPARSEGS